MTTTVINTCDHILEWMKSQAENKFPIDPFRWLEAAEKLNAMIGDETDKLIDLQHILAVETQGASEKLSSVPKAKTYIETLPLFVEIQKQKAKIERIKEAIRLAKLHGRLKSEELRSGL